MGNRRKPRPWRCGTHWRLTHTYKCGNAAACYFQSLCHQSVNNYRDKLGAVADHWGRPDRQPGVCAAEETPGSPKDGGSARAGLGFLR